mgnify:FL=1
MTFNFNKIKRILFAMGVGSFLLTKVAIAQEKLYPNEFPLSDVKLFDGPLKHAQDLKIGRAHV